MSTHLNTRVRASLPASSRSLRRRSGLELDNSRTVAGAEPEHLGARDSDEE
jgi:hypothetical protein